MTDQRDGWAWQAGWAPRHDEAFNAACVDRWINGGLGVAWSQQLADPRWDPTCRWVVQGPPWVSCGWTLALMNAVEVSPPTWTNRLGLRRAQRWALFPEPGSALPPLSASLLDELLTVPAGQDWCDGHLARRTALIRALGPDVLRIGEPDPLRPGWSRLPDPHQEGPLGRLVDHWRTWPLAEALLDLGATLAVRHADGRSDADRWLDQVGKMPGNDEVKTHWPHLLVRALRTVPPGPEWAAWKQSVPRGIVQRCLLDAAQQVEAQALRQALPPDNAAIRSRRPRL